MSDLKPSTIISIIIMILIIVLWLIGTFLVEPEKDQEVSSEQQLSIFEKPLALGSFPTLEERQKARKLIKHYAMIIANRCWIEDVKHSKRWGDRKTGIFRFSIDKYLEFLEPDGFKRVKNGTLYDYETRKSDFYILIKDQGRTTINSEFHKKWHIVISKKISGQLYIINKLVIIPSTLNRNK